MSNSNKPAAHDFSNGKAKNLFIGYTPDYQNNKNPDNENMHLMETYGDEAPFVLSRITWSEKK